MIRDQSYLFFVVDGVDGCGKSTQARLLKEAIEQKGHAVIQVRDPGGTKVSEEIRKVILNPDLEKMSPLTELFLYSASRCQLIEEVLLPKAQEGHVIVSDRYISSTIAYQAYGGEMEIPYVMDVVQLSIKKFTPTCTFIIDVPFEVARTRLDAKLDRMELKQEHFQRRVFEGFQALKMQEGYVSINGNQSIEKIHQDIMQVVNQYVS